MDGLQHLGFLHYTVCYSIGLPSLAVAVFVYLRTRSAAIRHFFPLLFAVTSQLVLATVLQYREANLAPYLTAAHFFLIHLYFAAGDDLRPPLSGPLHLVEVPRPQRRNAIFGAAALASFALVHTPFFLHYNLLLESFIKRGLL